ncbi:phage baseplate assembly protein [Erwinia aphidicola]|uniref:phage baseplate assembly protein n=1 Tax=Erwinia aphidicola TaxID=68334 RepID=UPI0030CFFD6C
MWNNVDNRINQALNRIRKAFRVVLNRTNSGGPLQTSQLSGLATEQLQDAELMQHYGFTSCPLPGTVGVVIPLGAYQPFRHRGHRASGVSPAGAGRRRGGNLYR